MLCDPTKERLVLSYKLAARIPWN